MPVAIVKAKLYTLSALIEYTKERIKNHTSSQEGDFRVQETMRNYLKECYCGDESDKLYVKQIIRRIITEPNRAEAENFPIDYYVNGNNIDTFIPWDNPRVISPYILFLTILYRYKKDYGSDTLGYLIEKYHFNNLRDRGGLDGPGFYIDDNDVRKMWEAENLHLTYEDKLEVLLQIVYEETFGNSCIDEILYQNVGDISAGVSGVPGDVTINLNNDMIPAYKTCWVRYKGCSIHFMFLSFGSNETLRKITNQIVGYKMKGQFSEQDGYKLGYGKDGSRRTAALPPFGESPAFWVRKFTEQASTNENLYGNIPGYEKVMEIEKVLVRGGATIPVCGPQGSGKTTKLETLVQYIQNFFSIRVLESEFEARLRWKYPIKNIFTMEANDDTPVTPDSAYNFSLRSAGDIYIIGEARSDDMIINVTRTANRGGRSVLFTFHPKTAEMTVPEIANAMIRQKMYVNLKDAVATALNTVKVCIFVTVDIETHNHYYEIYEFVPKPNLIPNTFMSPELTKEQRDLAFMQSVHAYMQTMAAADTYYDTVPIIVYDRITQKYEIKNTISDSLYGELLNKTPRREEMLDLMRVFRPNDFITAMCEDAQKAQIEVDDEFKENLIKRYGLDMRFAKKKSGLIIPDISV